MLSPLFTPMLLFLSLLHVSTAVAGANPSTAQSQDPTQVQSQIRRQTSATPSQAHICLDYERTANLSTIGANATYRTVLLQKSSTGTIYSMRMMDAAMKKLPALTADSSLNAACGNWTEIALQGAEKNFSLGLVAQYTTEGLPVGIVAGPMVVGICAAIAVLFSIVWVVG